MVTSMIHMKPENECVKAVESDHSFNSIELFLSIESFFSST